MIEIFPAAGIVHDKAESLRKRLKNLQHPTGVIIAAKVKPAKNSHGGRRYRDELARYLRNK